MPRPFKSPSSEHRDWEALAAQMHADAERLPPGPERTEALRKAAN